MQTLSIPAAAILALVLVGCGSDPGQGGTQSYKREERPFAEMKPADLPEKDWAEVVTTEVSMKVPRKWLQFNMTATGVEGVIQQVEKDNPQFKGMTDALMFQKQQNGLQIFACDPKSSGASDSASVVLFEAQPGATLDDAIKTGKDDIAKIAAGTVEYAEVQPPAGKFARIEYQTSQPGPDGKETKLACWAYISLMKGKTVTITFSTKAENAAAMEKTADAAITSFKLKQA